MSWFEFVQNVPCSAPLAFRIGIIGAGRVGGALARALSSHLAWIVARSPWRRAELRQFLQQTPIVGSLDEIAVAADVIIISVPDRAISAIAGELARCFSDQLEGKVLVHLSGALTATELAAAAAFGALAISAHPFTMVPTSDPAWLYGAMWGIEGNPRAFPFIEAIVHAVGGTPYVLGPTDAKRKALYHAAAVLASNVTTEVVALAQEVARLAGIPPERFLPPILRATVDNAVSALVSGMPIARTGPASRGDNQTLQRHLAALALFPELAERYRLLISALLVSDVRSDRSDRSTRPHSSELS